MLVSLSQRTALAFIRSNIYRAGGARSRPWMPRALFSTTASTAADCPSSLSIEGQKRKLARAALKHVPQYGWTQDAITAAVVDEKMNISMSGLLTPTELVNWLMDDFNHRVEGATVYEKIQWRLRQIIPLVESQQWQNGMAIGLLSTPLTTRNQLHEFIELVAPPGSSTVYKTGLGGIFVATELHMLSDKSPDYQDTWTFLQNRLEELDRGDLNLGDPSNIPLAATGAVASSVLEGIASLVMPSSTSSSPFFSVPGTRTSDYTPKKK